MKLMFARSGTDSNDREAEVPALSVSTADPKVMEQHFVNLRHFLTCDVPAVTRYQPDVAAVTAARSKIIPAIVGMRSRVWTDGCLPISAPRTLNTHAPSELAGSSRPSPGFSDQGPRPIAASSSKDRRASENRPHCAPWPGSISPMNWPTWAAKTRPCKLAAFGSSSYPNWTVSVHAEVARIKAFMSRTTDRFRPPYGIRLVESPRQCVFAGTVNHSTYLRDETGGRRFWPVVCGRIDIDALAGDRDQLWAEAKVRFESGSVWWLDTPDSLQLASDQQEARYEGDPWEEVIGPWLEGKQSTAISEVLEKCINKPQAQWTQTDKIRAARCLRAQGWVRYRERQSNRLEWRYRKVG
jgi:hypothetical protein